MNSRGGIEPSPAGLLNRAIGALAVACMGLYSSSVGAAAAEKLPAAEHFRERVQPILETYCYGCHGYGSNEGGRTLDEFASDEAMVGDTKLWLAVLKNVRAGIMPPAGEARPTGEEQKQLFDWIKFEVFGIDPANPDPGRVTLRRLNRVEYRNTIRDLMGVDFNATNEFPADDAGFGFDNIGDVLSVSPLLMEKYLHAAEKIVGKAVPTKALIFDEQRIDGKQFRPDDKKTSSRRMSYYEPATVAYIFSAKETGKYRLVIELALDGAFEFDPARCRMTFFVDGKKLHQEEYSWADNEARRFEVDVPMEQGKRRFEFQIEPLVDKSKQLSRMELSINSVIVRGPIETQHLVEDKNYRRFFFDGPAPEDPEKRDAYARDVLRAFAHRAYRRPVGEQTIDRLAALARQTYADQDKSFEEGIGQAMIAALASPRFLFRVEDVVAEPGNKPFVLVDEHSLASRLSYFLWSTMPDDELLELADHGELRTNLPRQVERMVKDPRSESLADNFAGQWLRSRDVEHFEIDAIEALGLDSEWDALRARARTLFGDSFRRRDRDRDEEDKKDDSEKTPEELERDKAREQLRLDFRRLRDARDMFNSDLRSAMRRETEMYFEHVVRDDRSVLELIDSNYTYLNETLAEHYGIADVSGQEMRRVELPADSPRGGVLTQGTLLVVTSNPTRTSPVKRGLYILDAILGTPPPPPPANVPPLEASGDAITDHEPTVRELQEQHRRDPLCKSCHSRMDPLGLAMENFNAVGMWRETERGQPIDSSGTLLTGEEFKGIKDLKRILREEHRQDFYRCLTEKLLTYALGRGLEYYDEHTVDEIVARLEQGQGKFSALLLGVVESAPFQKERRKENLASVP